ncbi:MAG TPA: hypothetical protein VE173_12530 [Longimicrobiales bacterium]|nr:hypothetical protein [Longimicrobiales bacterium]
MSPQRHLLSEQARTILNELGIGLHYVGGGVVHMGDAEGGPCAPVSMESVEEACAAVAEEEAFQDAAHRLEVFQEALDDGQGLDLRTSRLVGRNDPDPVESVLGLLGRSDSGVLFDDRTAELVAWEQIQDELRPSARRRAPSPEPGRRT